MKKNINKSKVFIIFIMMALLVGCSNKKHPVDDNAKITDKQDIVDDNPVDEVIEEDIVSINKAKEYLSQNWDSVKIDGSTSMVPLHQALNNMFSTNKEKVKHGKTVEAFDKFIRGENDILLGVTYSDELLNKAKTAGMDFVGSEITKEAFVFLVNKENPVKSLTIEQIKGIYSGKITNWSEVGGNDEAIVAYQRNDDSGSQMRMNIFMGDEKLVEKTYISEGMGELVLAIADFNISYPDKNKQAIGFNMYTFTEKQYLNNDVVLLKVNGIKPDDNSIFDENYPIGIYNYLCYDRNNESASEFASNLYTFLMSSEGQRLINRAGYVNTKEKLKRTYGVDFSDEKEEFTSFYNKEKGEFYDVSPTGERIVFNKYSDFILRNSKYKDNQKAQDFLMRLFNSGFVSSRVGCVDKKNFIVFEGYWFTPVLTVEDFFNIEFNGNYYTGLSYYFLEEKYVLDATLSDSVDGYRDEMINMDCPLEFIASESIEITKEDLQKIRFRIREAKEIHKYSDIKYENVFH